MNRTQRFISRTAVLLALLSLWTLPSSQAGDDWLPIPPADLALKDNPAQPGAHAMILYRDSEVNSKEASEKEYIRIKIFTEQGTGEANVQIPFLKGAWDIKDIHARTIQPDGTVTNFNGEIFDKTVVKVSGVKFLAKTFTLSDVHPGSIIEYKYRQQSDPYFLRNEKWIVSNHLFTRDARFSFKPYTGVGALPFSYRQFGLPENSVPQLQKDGSYLLEIHNIAGIEDEKFMPPEDVLNVRVEFFYRNPREHLDESPDSYWTRKGVQWADSLDQFVNKKNVLLNELRTVFNPDDPPEIKLQKIYARVQKIRNLSEEQYKTQKEQKQEQLKPNLNVEDVLKHSYAYGRDINYTFVGLAREAGFEATVVWVAPRNQNFFFPKMKDSTQLDSNIVWVRSGTKEYYLDPAAAYYPFGMLPWYETASDGVRVGKQNAEIVKTPAAVPADAHTIRHADMVIDEDGLATGKIEVEFTGLRGATHREEAREEDETGRRKSLENEIKRWLPAGSSFEITNVSNWDNNGSPLHIEGTAKIPNLGTTAGHRMLVTEEVFQASQAAAFEPEKRVYPIYFRYPYEEIDSVKLRAPQGFRIENVPAVVKVNRGPVSYEISAVQQDNCVEVKRDLLVTGIMFPVTAYPALREFFNTVKTNDDAQIVFQTAESAKNN
ncbi:MAG: DUF3857 domain-containing protein [Candidatus Acidiferrales bacterium]